MRNSEDYKRLIDGYAFRLGLLKQYNKKAYKFIMATQKLMEENGNKFSKLVNCLRVDYVRENDEKIIEEPEILIDVYPMIKKTYAVSYLPSYDYALSFLYQEEGAFSDKRLCYILYPVNESYIREKQPVPLFEISKVSTEGKVVNNVTYQAGIAEDLLVVVKQDDDKPSKARAVKDIVSDKLKGIGDEYIDLF